MSVDRLLRAKTVHPGVHDLPFILIGFVLNVITEVVSGHAMDFLRCKFALLVFPLTVAFLFTAPAGTGPELLRVTSPTSTELTHLLLDVLLLLLLSILRLRLLVLWDRVATT